MAYARDTLACVIVLAFDAVYWSLGLRTYKQAYSWKELWMLTFQSMYSQAYFLPKITPELYVTDGDDAMQKISLTLKLFIGPVVGFKLLVWPT